MEGIMMTKLERELTKVLAKLSPDEQERVLEYVRSLVERDRGSPETSLLALVGTISPEDLEVMRETVAEMRGTAVRVPC
jgi:hypothetical protein